MLFRSKTAKTFTLVRYSLAKGVTVSGTIDVKNDPLPLSFRGLVTVAGPAASAGIVGLTATSLRGTLGGKAVGP